MVQLFRPVPRRYHACVSKTVLVVEDDHSLRRMYRFALALAGFTVQEAPDGLEALQLIEAGPPDLVVLDLTLPHVSGFAVRQEIAAHAHTRDIPILIVTGSTAELPDIPCVLRKPISPEQLVDAVRNCLASGSVRPL